MTDKNKIIDELNDSTSLLLNSIKGVSEKDFNIRNAQGTWSVGDICEHITKIEESIISLISTADTKAERDPAEKVNTVRDRFGDTETKFKAGEPISATETSKDKNEMIKKLTDCRKKLTDVINEYDIEKECHGFEHGIFGYMTGVEWIYYNIHHTKRHALQINSRQADFQSKK